MFPVFPNINLTLSPIESLGDLWLQYKNCKELRDAVSRIEISCDPFGK